MHKRIASADFLDWSLVLSEYSSSQELKLFLILTVFTN